MSDKTITGVVTWLRNWFYTKSEVDSLVITGGSTSESITDKVYPIGSIYMSINSTNPSELFGGEWEQIKDTFLLACGTKHSNGSTGGSEDAVVVSHNHTQVGHTHEPSNTSYKFLGATTNIAINGTKRAFPSTSTDGHHIVYTDDATGGINEYATTSSVAPTINSKGESGTGKNMPPFLTVYMWKRTG